jgi:hypothetical protein
LIGATISEKQNQVLLENFCKGGEGMTTHTHTKRKNKNIANSTRLIDRNATIKHNCLKVDKAKGLTQKLKITMKGPFHKTSHIFTQFKLKNGGRLATYAGTSEYCSMTVTMKFLPAQVWQREFLSITPWRGSISP